MSNPNLIAVVVSLALAGLCRMAAAEEKPPQADQPQEEPSTRASEEYLKELDEKIEKMRERVRQMREDQKRQEMVAPLAERALAKVTEEDYTAAAAALDEWRRADPADPRVTLLRALVWEMAHETDERRRTELLREYLDAMTAPAPAPAPES